MSNQAAIFETIIYEKQAGVACITLNRPRALNTINVRMRDDLYEAVSAIRDDDEVEVAIFRGAGDRAFSAGADLTEFGTAPSRVIARETRWERDLWGLLLAQEKPLIAAIHGFALGAGSELAMCCDLRVATEDARFGLPEVGLGMIPAAGGTQTLPRLIPRGAAARLLLTGEVIDAREAHRLGLVHRVVSREALMATAEEIARSLLARAQPAVRLAKEAIVRGLDLGLEEGLALEARLFSRLLGDEEAVAALQEAVRAGGAPPGRRQA